MPVRSAKIVLTADASQAIRETKALGDAAEQSATRIEGAGRRTARNWDGINRGARNTFVAGATGLAFLEKANISFDKSMSSVDAAYNLQGKRGVATLDELRQAAIKAGADTKFSATEGAQGITELAKAGVSAKDVLGGGLDGALSLAAAGGIEVADAAETAASAMTQFELKGKDVVHIADLLAAGAGKAQGSVGDLSMALGQSGLVAAQTGLSIEDTVGTLSAFASAGLLGSDAGTSFKTMLMSLNPRSAEAAALMKKYNIEAYDAQGNFIGIDKYAGKLRQGLKGLSTEQRQAALQTIFGSDAIRAANILYRNGERGIDRWTKKVDDQGYAAKTAAKQTDNLAGDIERFTGSLESAFIEAGSGGQDGLRDMVKGAEKLVDTFSDLPDEVQSGIVKVAALGTAIAGAVYVGGKIAGGVSAIRDVLPGRSKGPLGGAGSGRASGVVPVYVTNLGKAGLGPGGAAGGKGGPVVAGGPGTAAATTRRGRAAATAGRAARGAGSGILIAAEVVGAAKAVDMLNEAIQRVGDRGKESGPLKEFSKPKSKINEVLFGKGHTLQKDLDTAIGALKFNGKFSGIEEGLGRALGGTGFTKSLDNVRDLDSSLASLSKKNPSAGLQAYRDVMHKSGISATQLNKVLPETAQALGKVEGAVGKVTDAGGFGRQVADARRYREALKGMPKAVVTKVTAKGADLSRADVRQLKRQYDLTPKQVRTLMRLVGDGDAKKKAVDVGKSLRDVGRQRPTPKVSVPSAGAARNQIDKVTGSAKNLGRQRPRPSITARDGATPIIRRVGSELSNLNGNTATTYVYTRHISVGSKAGTAANPTLNAMGGLYPAVRAYARGGFGDVANHHQPELARNPGVTPRMWLEAETRGEAYIPLANDYRRPRARAIAAETVKLLGGVATFAQGGVTKYATGGYATAGGITVLFPTPAVLAASVLAAEKVAVSAAKTARSHRDTQDATLAQLQAQQRVNELERSLNERGRRRVRGRDGVDDDKRKKGMQDKYRYVGYSKLSGIARDVAQAELAIAKRDLTDLRNVQSEIDALTERRTTTTATLTGQLDIFSRGAGIGGATGATDRYISEVTQYGDTVARLKAAGASGALLQQIVARAEQGDFRSAVRLGKALLAQPAAIGRLNASLGYAGQIAGSVAQLTTDPRLMASGAWNPSSTVVRQVQVSVSPDFPSYAALRAQITHDVTAAIAGATS